MPKKYKYKQYVILEFNNTGPCVELFQSDEPITVEKVHEFYKKTDDFNEDKDAFTFVGSPRYLVLK